MIDGFLLFIICVLIFSIFVILEWCRTLAARLNKIEEMIENLHIIEEENDY